MGDDKRDFESLWQKSDSLSSWSVADNDVRGLIPRLRKEKRSRVLDLGFGLGRHVVLFAGEGFATSGIEPSASGFRHCARWLQSKGLEADIRQADMLQLPFGDEEFDFVLCYNVIYHARLGDMESALAEIRRVLRKTGLLFFTLNSTRNEWCGKGTELEHNTFLNFEKGDGDHEHHYSDGEEVQRLLGGWRVERLREAEQNLAGKVYPGSWHWTILARKP